MNPSFINLTEAIKTDLPGNMFSYLSDMYFPRLSLYLILAHKTDAW